MSTRAICSHAMEGDEAPAMDDHPVHHPTHASVPASATGVVRGERPPESGATELPPSLESLLEKLGPLASAYFANDQATQRRELEFEERILEVEARRDRVAIVAIATIVLAVFGLATFLFARGRDATAMELIQVIIGLVGAAFGGYGVASSRRRGRREEPEGQ